MTKSHSECKPSVSSRTSTVTADIEHVDHESPPVSPVPDHQPFSDSIEQQLTIFLQSLIAGATLVEKRGKELHFLLPLLQARPQNLAHLFAELEHQKDSLGIVSYGLTACSMEEVCMYTLIIIHVHLCKTWSYIA